MLKTTKLLSITVPKPIYREIHREAKKRKTTVSGLLRTAFQALVSPNRVASTTFQNDSHIHHGQQLLKELEKIQTKGGDPNISQNIDKILYGEGI